MGVDLNSFMDNLTLGMVRYLEKLSCIKKVVVVEKPFVQEAAIATWEQKNNCVLPPDLKNFYLATDGIQIRWSWKMKDDIVPGGIIDVVRLSQLKSIGPKKPNSSELPTVIDAESDLEDEPEEGIQKKLKFKSKSKIFVLDKCQGVGKVCLVFHSKKDGSADVGYQPSSIWFLDRALEFHYLSPDFISYYRLSLVHLGIPQWQYLFTPSGAPPKTKLMLHIFAPERLYHSLVRISHEQHSSS